MKNIKEYKRNYYLKNIEKYKKLSKERYLKEKENRPEKMSASEQDKRDKRNKQKRDNFKNMTPEEKQKRREYNRSFQINKRLEAINILGNNKCIKCGFSDIRALQIDHINSDGHNERKIKEIYSLYNEIIKNPEESKIKYQILCANCNWIKRYENSELPRK